MTLPELASPVLHGQHQAQTAACFVQWRQAFRWYVHTRVDGGVVPRSMVHVASQVGAVRVRPIRLPGIQVGWGFGKGEMAGEAVSPGRLDFDAPWEG